MPEHSCPAFFRRFARTHPAVQVNVVCDYSTNLQEKLRHGDVDAALVTEGELLSETATHRVVYEEDLVWLGAKNGTAPGLRPLARRGRQ